MKQELLKLKEKIKKAIIPEHLQRLEEMSKSEDPLGFGAVVNAIDMLVQQKNQITNEEKETEKSCLQNKVYVFAKWYYKNIEQKSSVDVNSNELKNFIEKMAVWYELRYPDYEIRQKVHYGDGFELFSASYTMFHQNPYINALLYEDSDVQCLDWDEFYNTKAFINSLPAKEKRFLERPKYPNIVYWKGGSYAHLHLTSKGRIEESEYMNCVVDGISNLDLEGMHIKTAVDWLKERGVTFPERCEFIDAIKNYENRVYAKEELLNCVMYRILERGGNRIGPRRAFLFAKEFKRNIDIPMKYGLDTSDPNLRLFVNEYLKAGGSKELECYINYYDKESDCEKLYTKTIEDFLQSKGYNEKIRYTEEEKHLHQRFVNVLNAQIPVEEIQKQEETNEEKTKRLRIERKLDKARNYTNKQ